MKNIKTILVTGASGYIGSHTCLELLDAGYNVIALDNLINSNEESLTRVQKITAKTLDFIHVDIRDAKALVSVFKQYDIHAVIHFAGLKAVGESVENPLKYYENNVVGTIVLLEVMTQYQVKNIVFSSSATVYGAPDILPITENATLSSTNPYGASKLMIENILQDVYVSDSEWNISILRYFNPIGAHVSGLIGEDPDGIPNNLMPYIMQVAVGKLDNLPIYGNDYSTKDGTGVRDYIHVVDLAKGHIKALMKLESSPGCMVHNLGTGLGYSVLEMVKAIEGITKKIIPCTTMERRAGDVAACYADATKAEIELQWVAKKNITDMCQDAWRWQFNNPKGYN